nr:galactose oxidase early set domain-containing protein [Pseudonocardia sp. C8]
MELYSPPYLFRGPRPAIDQAPPEAGWDAEIAVSVSGPAVTQACLIRCGSSTHSFNSDQRHVGLTIVSRTGGTVVLRTPPNGFVAPPGYYLLFVLSGAGVPSVAAMIRLG